MSAANPGSIFEAFNARSLEPFEVAATFVPSVHYDLLANRTHSMIIGPRGSGKTTLLKMLQQPALEAWHHARADEFRSRIDFTGVFVPTDISWSQKVRCMGQGLDDETRRVLSIAVFTTHVLRSLLRAMLDRITPPPSGAILFRRIRLSEKKESTLSKALCEAWHLNRTVPSLLAIKQALSLRLSQVRELANEELLRGPEGRVDRLARIKFLNLHFLQSASYAAELFDDVTAQPAGRWALLFDELELAPEWIQHELVISIRSTEPNLLFKLAINPFSPSALLMRAAEGAAPKQDFEQIPLWYAEKRDAYPFCERLWYQMLKQKGLPEKSPKEALGVSYFENPESEWKGAKNAYGPHSKIGRLFVDLANDDHSFASYLRTNSIDPHRLHDLSSSQRAADVRKVAPLVVVREFFRRSRLAEHSEGRSRKNPHLYAGAESLFAISEGNPRWFIGLLNRLFARWEDRSRPISPAVQADEMYQVAHTFSALLGTLPVPAPSQGRGLLSIIRTVGDRFHREVVHEAFSDEPPLTFIVDSFMTGNALELLATGLNAGAFVYIPGGESELVLATKESLRGKRFRISYLLAPVYRLPIRLGRGVALSRLLRTAHLDTPELFGQSEGGENDETSDSDEPRS